MKNVRAVEIDGVEWLVMADVFVSLGIDRGDVQVRKFVRGLLDEHRVAGSGISGIHCKTVLVLRSAIPKISQFFSDKSKPHEMVKVSISHPREAQDGREIMRDLISNMFEGHEIRTAIKDDGSVWFVLKDVCDALEINNPSQISARVRDTYKGYIKVDTLGGPQQVVIVSEHGLYQVIFGSRSASAEPFQDWVFEVVIPSIRKTGSYGEVAHVEVPKTFADALRLAADQAEATERALAEARAARLLVEEAKPKVEYHDRVLKSEETFDVTMIAKELGFRSGVALNQWLYHTGVQYPQAGKWELYADYCGKGYTANKTDEFGGKLRTRMVWTQKGRKMIHELVEKLVPKLTK